MTTKQVVDFITQNMFFGGLVAVILQIHIIIIIYFIYFNLLHFYYNKFLYVYIFYNNMEHLKENDDKSKD